MNPDQKLADIPIETLIPQRNPMVMIDRVRTYEPGKIETEMEITPSRIFVKDGKFSESGMLENIAQSAAAMVGMEARKNQSPVPLGFIGGIGKVKVHGYAFCSDLLHTQVEILQEVFGITLIRGKCSHQGTVLLECEMKIVVKP